MPLRFEQYEFESHFQRSGISTIFPEALLDGFLFEPCGYSVNGMMGPYYFTIHITPQEAFSFASFETDMPLDDYDDLVARVLNIFRPGRSTVTIMANYDSKTPSTPHAPQGFVVRDVQRQELSRYHITYSRVFKAGTPLRRQSTVSPPEQPAIACA